MSANQPQDMSATRQILGGAEADDLTLTAAGIATAQAADTVDQPDFPDRTPMVVAATRPAASDATVSQPGPGSSTVASTDTTEDEGGPKPIPGSYHGPLISSITVFLAFSLGFARYWTFDAPGDWDIPTFATMVIVVIGLALQMFALYRALDLKDDFVDHYLVTVRVFFAGVIIAIIGIVISGLLAQ